MIIILYDTEILYGKKQGEIELDDKIIYFYLFNSSFRIYSKMNCYFLLIKLKVLLTF